MDTTYDALPESPDRIVYVRPLAVAGLPAEIREQLGAAETV